MNPTFIIQARSNSTRLPFKMTRLFYKEFSILEIIINRIKRSFPNSKIIIATTDHKSDDKLVNLISKLSVFVYRGSIDNVISRFIAIGDQYGVEEFVRVCSDNLFLDMGLLHNMISNYSKNIDYMTYKVNGKPSMKTSFGFFAEISKISVLKSVVKNTDESEYLEHVTNYIYSNPGQYRLKFLDTDKIFNRYADIRFTIDTITDFNIAKVAYKTLLESNPNFDYLDVINWAIENNKLELMATENNKNIK
ncbi:cytidylyltransferase domain-containing protein [Cyclobacterium amurskyense]|uniref:Acylneuraminate cytidylyltransferase n=1 Tax=Cyclobacterium amurskyense TaxID=320787 RepID=A0A0H4PEX7_9BACT|nr:hypothetical protein [Cyclobacterium amurskyense]AKP53011.1 hypothetical protein CA2015_3634 [Cyclobacterium amurskyense]